MAQAKLILAYCVFFDALAGSFKLSFDEIATGSNFVTMRKIIHVDMDAYFAAIEIRENPSLKGKCVIVGGAPNSRGVVTTCSYEARKFGVRSGMPSHQAWNLCPQGVFVHCNFQLYKAVSAQIKEIFYRYTDLVEPASLDEAYLDVTQNKAGIADAATIAKMIKQDILNQTRLTCSAGVSFNKFLAKIGSDMNKPDGLTIISPSNASEILFALPVHKFHGIGKVTAAKMQKLGIHTGADLYRLELKDLVHHFGKVGLFFYNIIRGTDPREVVCSWDPKSISCENTFEEDIGDIRELISQLDEITDRLASRMRQKGIKGRSLTLKIKYASFEINTRSFPLPELTFDKHIIMDCAQKLLVANWRESDKIRLLGVGIGKLDLGKDDAEAQLLLSL